MLKSFTPSRRCEIQSPLDRQTILERLRKVVQTNKDSWVMTGKSFYGSLSEDEFEVYRYDESDYELFKRRNHMRVMLHGQMEDSPDGTKIAVREYIFKWHQHLYHGFAIMSVILAVACIAMILLVVLATRNGWVPAEKEQPTVALPFLVIYLVIVAVFRAYGKSRIFDGFKTEAATTRNRLMELINGSIVQVHKD